MSKTMALDGLKGLNRSFSMHSSGAILLEVGMPTKPVELLGRKINHLLVRFIHGKNKHGHTMLNCLCDCGKSTVVSIGDIVRNHTKSCGCLQTIRDNLSSTKIYNVWSHMIKRCYNKKTINFNIYGGRGIKVCSQWKESFIKFYKWSIENNYKEGLCIDRIDNDGDYTPENCRYTTKRINNINKSMSRFYIINGMVFDSQISAAKHYNVCHEMIRCWCLGYKRGKYVYPAKENCYALLKYGDK